MNQIQKTVAGVQKSAIKSWKTSLAGVLAALALVEPHLQALLDNNPDTAPDYNVIVTGIFMIVYALSAKDGDKSTEDHLR